RSISSPWSRSGSSAFMASASWKSAAPASTSPAATPRLPAPGWPSKRGSWPGCSRKERSGAATCSATATPSFTASFDEVFRSVGVEVIRLPYRAPRANCFADRWVGTVRRELLDHLLIFGRRHLGYVLREFVKRYYEARSHQGLGQRVPRHSEPA